MYQTLIKNKWATLAFVVLMLAVVQYGVGSMGDDGSFASSPARPAVSGEERGETEQEFPQPDLTSFYEGGDAEFVADEDLIDATEGFDPSPPEDDFAGEGFPPDPEVEDDRSGPAGAVGNADSSGNESEDPIELGHY